MVAIPTESRASSRSPTMAGLSTPARRKDGRTDTSGAAQLPIMSKTRNILSVQTILVSIPRENTTVRKPHFSGSVYIGRQAGRSRLHMRSTTFVSSGPERHGTSFIVKDPPKFPSHLGKWHQGKSPPVHLFLTHWDHYVIKDACMRKSVGTPTGLKMTQEAGWNALAFVLAKTVIYSKWPFNLFGWKNESKKWI